MTANRATSGPDDDERRLILEEARRLPREPMARWVWILVVVAVAAWLVSLAWQIRALPARVPTHWGSTGSVPDGWSSKPEALAFAALMPLLVALPLPLMARLAVSSPRWINAPNREWWTTAPRRMRRFERLVREDLWILASGLIAMVAAAGCGIVVASRDPEGHSPGWMGPLILAFVLVPAAVVVIRMTVGSRYAEQEIEETTDPDEI